ncbi:hypothetical protein F5Y14DRAFT_458565 [Nemania sp. NC0429]|nr:hypothetical protein F5Y14DRAFT_458565 [Nemania sp. NC0429]
MASEEIIEPDQIMGDDELFSDSDGSELKLSEEEEAANEEKEKGGGGKHAVLRPKIPFSERANPFVGPKDKKFQKIENYFFSLLRTPGLTIENILEGTFDAHETHLIMPQSGPPDVVNWQRKNARRYHENLETRFKGHADTLAFKMACLYFGLPVEPLRMGTMSFELPPDPDPLDANRPTPSVDPLDFLRQYEKEDDLVYGQSALSPRGGGGNAYAAIEEEGDAIPLGPTSGTFIPQYHKTPGEAIHEIPPEGYEMDVVWDTNPESVDVDMQDEAAPPPQQIRLYGWQGAVVTTFRYSEFVLQADRLISNWDHVDLPICLDIWRASPAQFEESAIGTIYHGDPYDPTSDTIWDLLRKYFKPDSSDEYVCFIRRGDESDNMDKTRPHDYEPSSGDRYVVRIENQNTSQVAYMRIPRKLHAEHKPHQFSEEYTKAMQVLMLPEAPHALVSYQHGFIGDTYQSLDPPGGLWEQVIEARRAWGSVPAISFRLISLPHEVVPVLVPGVFASVKQFEMSQMDFELTNSTEDSSGLSRLYRIIESSVSKTSLNKECNGFEIWCSGPKFKQVTQQPTRIRFSGTIENVSSLEDWQGFLAGVDLNEPFSIVVRPVYKAYRLQKPDSSSQASLQLNEYDLNNFRAFVYHRLYPDYDPNDNTHVISVGPVRQESYQLELTIRPETTEEEWQWIRRNIIEPELIVSVGHLGNEWRVPYNAVWGAKYASWPSSHSTSTPSKKAIKSSPGSKNMSAGQPFSPITGKPRNVPGQKRQGPTKNTTEQAEQALNTLFKDSKNTSDEAKRMRALRDRSFTRASSIFTNPLKPVMPLHGPPLESIIKTGPGMPGVSIAMMTPTEMLQLQREVHALRSQLLDRTRECPYADCDRYFTFADGEGLDQHIREDHNVLRCFLCDKNQHLLPYYDVEQIKGHFVEEHVQDVLEAFRGLQVRNPPAAPAATTARSERTERRCELFHICGAVTTHMTAHQLREHMMQHAPSPMTSDKENAPEESPQPEFGPDAYDTEEEETKEAGQKRMTQVKVEPMSGSYSISPSPPPMPKKANNPPPLTRRPWEAVLREGRDETTTKSTKPTQQQPATIAERRRKPTKTGAEPLLSSSSSSVADAGETTNRSKARKRRRRRVADLDTTYVRKSGDEDYVDYEYSERSAVTDPLAELEPAPPVPKKQRVTYANAPPPTPTPMAAAAAAAPAPATVESASSTDV